MAMKVEVFQHPQDYNLSEMGDYEPGWYYWFTDTSGGVGEGSQSDPEGPFESEIDANDAAIDAEGSDTDDFDTEEDVDYGPDDGLNEFELDALQDELDFEERDSVSPDVGDSDYDFFSDFGPRR